MKPVRNHFHWGLMLLVVAGCATAGPRMVEVSHQARVVNIAPADERMFARDRATDFQTQIVPLTVDEQREEFFIHWRTTGVRAVKLQYRQAHRPGEVRQHTQPVAKGQTAVIRVGGAEYREGGPVTAWRVSLWNEAGQELAATQSVLW